MNRCFVAIVAAAVSAVLLAVPGFACTTVCLLEKGRPFVAYNYDFDPSEGLVFVNKRETTRRSRAGQGAVWTARYGSVTFNQFGRDNPTTGLNEKGLMVSLGWLEGTRYPPVDHRPAVGTLEWIQYNLDHHASVAEVVANAGAVRPTSRTPIHYFFADASGDAAVIEFLDGKLVVHRDETLPVRALTNSTYVDSLAALDAARRRDEMPTSLSSLDRFVRGHMLAVGEGDPIARGFATLAAVTVPDRTRWSIVYDLAAGEVHFKTDTNEAVRRFTVSRFDLSCRTPVKVLDVTAAGSGDVAGAFVDYTRAANRALLDAAHAKTPFLRRRSGTETAAAAAHADETSVCAVKD